MKVNVLIVTAVLSILCPESFAITLTDFTYLGEVNERSSNGELMGNQRQSSLYLSDYMASQNQSVLDCEEVGGRLSHVLTFTQDEDVRYKLIDSGTPGLMITTWTSGRYNFENKDWYWLSIQRPIIYTNWLHTVVDPAEDRCIGIAVIYSSPVYGWTTVSCEEDTKLKFLCTV